MRIDIDINYCSGCMACINACPENAMTMIENENGFILPHIDDDKCIDCGICYNVCDFIKEKKEDLTIKEAYSLVINDKEALYNSTSGGAFTAISDFVLKHGGVVVGAVMEDDFTVKHVVAETTDERDKMRGSKYVQSDIGFLFRKIKKFVKNDRYVMFVGTPCQCAGLESYLGKDRDKVLIVDFLCHGVPNNAFFKEHIKYMEEYSGKKIKDYSFRGKKYGWTAAVQYLTLSDKKKIAPIKNQAYKSFFSKNNSLRNSCFNCKYRSHHRYSDITIADFWSIEKFTKKKNEKGVSFILINSNQGKDIIQETKQTATLNQYPVEDILFRVSTKPPTRNKTKEFWDTYHEKGYSALIEKYYKPSLYRKFRFMVKKIVKSQMAKINFSR